MKILHIKHKAHNILAIVPTPKTSSNYANFNKPKSIKPSLNSYNALYNNGIIIKT